MLRFRRPALGLLVLMTLWPSMVFGQGQRAGVVTILEGQATVKRVALPDPIPLKFKDDVFLQDRVETGEKSLVRVLLGGAALVTIRARSIATITEIPGKSTVNLNAGKISLAVARDRLRPGDSLEIRTVNAVAAIRGTVVVAEVIQGPPGAGGNASAAVVTNFHVLRGTVSAVNLDPTTGAPLTAPQPVSGGQSFSAVGTAAPTIGPNPPVAVVTAGLTPGQPQHSHAANGAELSARAVETARLLVQSLIGPVPGDTALSVQGPAALALPPSPETLIQPEVVTLPSLPKLLPGGGDLASLLIPVAQTSPAATSPAAPPPGGGPVSPAAGLPAGPPPPPPAPLPQTFSPLPGLLASTVMGPFLQPPPGPVIVLSPSGQALLIAGTAIEIPLGDILALDRPLLAIIDRVLSTGSLLGVPGALASTTTDVLLFVDPSVVNTSGPLISVPGTLTLAGPLFLDVGGTFNLGGSLLTVTGELTSTASSALLGFVDSSVTAGVDPVTAATSPARLVDLVGSATTPATLSLAGSLLEAVDSTFVTTREAVRILTGGMLVQNGTSAPLLVLTGGSITSGTHLLQVSGLAAGGAVPTQLSLSGPLLEASSLSVDTGDSLVSVESSTLAAIGTTPFIASDASTFTVGAGATSAAALRVSSAGSGNAASASFATSFLASVDDSFAVLGDLVRLDGRATLTTGAAPLVTSTGSGFDLGLGSSGGGLLMLCCPDGVSGHAPTATLQGPLLSASGSSIVARLAAIQVAQGAHLEVGPAALVDLSDSSLTVIGGHFLGLVTGGTLNAGRELLKTVGGHVTLASDAITVTGGSALVAAAPLLRVTGTTLTIGGRLINAEGDLAVVRTAFSPPPANSSLLTFDFSGGGHLTVGATLPHAIVARGFATQDHADPDFGTVPSLGTDRPLVHQGAGPMLEVKAARTDTAAASVDVDVTGSAVLVDTALLQATAPFIGLTQAAMKTSSDAVSIFQKARVEAGDLVRLDRSRLDVVNGHLVGVAGGSLLRAHNLLTVANGSRVNIQNGALLSVLGSSFASITGCLVCFTGANSVVTVTNSIPATGSLFGFPIAGTVQVGAGATAASVFPGLGANGNQLTVNGVLVNVGAGSALKLQ